MTHFLKNKNNSTALNCVLVLFGLVLFFFAAFRPVGLDRDSINYAEVIAKGYSDESINEPTFNIIKYVSGFLFPDVTLGVFIIYALLGVSIKIYSIKKLSYNPIFSAYMYLFFYFILHEMTQIRVGVASGFFLLSIYDRLKGDNFKSLAKIALAVSFHFSAIIGLVIFIFDCSKINRPFFVLLPFLGVVLYLLLSNQGFMQYLFFLPETIYLKMQLYIELKNNGLYDTINVFNVLYIFLAVVYYLSLIKINKINPSDYIYIKLIGVSLFSFYAMSFLPVFAFRISEFFSVVIIIFISNMIYIFDSYKSKLFYMLFMFVLGAVYFVNQELIVNLKLFGR